MFGILFGGSLLLLWRRPTARPVLAFFGMASLCVPHHASSFGSEGGRAAVAGGLAIVAATILWRVLLNARSKSASISAAQDSPG